MIPDRKWSPKWTANDPRSGPQMIPEEDRKWSPKWTANDPREKITNGMDFGSLDFFSFLFFSFFFFFID